MKQYNDILKKGQKVFFITGGGTGGHIYPALAVLKEIKKQIEDPIIYYIGNESNLEYEVVRKNEPSVKFLSVDVNGMPRKLSLSLIRWFIKVQLAVFKSVFYIFKYRPNFIFATGGYVSAPIVIASKMSDKKYMLHDCDSFPGLVTRFASSGASCVSLAFEQAKKYINNQNVFINGNPIREEFKNLDKLEAKQNLNLDGNKNVILFMGGSQGAMTINNCLVEMIDELIEIKNCQVILQTGVKNYDQIKSKLGFKLSKFYGKLVVKPYFEKMYNILKASDIVVSRAGSLSISEICASKVAPILIPYPFAASGHQKNNAKTLFEKDACIMIEENDNLIDQLRKSLYDLIDNKDRIKLLKDNSYKLCKFDCAKNVVEQLYRFCLNSN